MLIQAPPICPTCEWYDPVSTCPWCGERKALAAFQQVFWKYYWLILGSAFAIIRSYDIQAGAFTILLTGLSLTAILGVLRLSLRSRNTLSLQYRHLWAHLLRLEQDEGYIPADAVAIHAQAWREAREKALEIEYLIWANKLRLSALQRHFPDSLMNEGLEIAQKLHSHSPNNELLGLLQEQITWLDARPNHDQP